MTSASNVWITVQWITTTFSTVDYFTVSLGKARLLTAPTAGAGHTVPMVTQAVEEVTAKVERINKYFGFRIKLFTRCTFCMTYTTY